MVKAFKRTRDDQHGVRVVRAARQDAKMACRGRRLRQGIAESVEVYS